MIDWFYPNWLLALWLVPVVGFILFSAARWRARTAKKFADAPMLQKLAPRISVAGQIVKTVLALTAFTCLLLAIARPRWGSYMQDVTTSGTDIFILLDVSRSMLAEDVKPNRLKRAKSDILDLIDRTQGDRVGLVAFAGSPLLTVPLTTDLDYFRDQLADLNPDSIGRGGSMPGDAILKALSSMESQFDRQQVIVMVTDGEDQDSFPDEAAKAAAERGVRIITVGLGDPDEGARIPIRDENGSLSYVQYDDQEVWSVLEEETLKGLAEATGGAYIPARTSVYDLGEIYETQLASVVESEGAQKRQRKRERFQWFAAAGLFCLILDGLLTAFRSPAQQS